MHKIVIAGLALAVVLGTVVTSGSPVPIILDTDMASDCDDAGAVAILHTLADRGEANILGLGVCVRNRWTAPALDAINTYYGRPDIPIGTIDLNGSDLARDSVYTETLAKKYPNSLKDGLNAPEVVSVYRKILAQQPDHSVVFVAIGWLTNFKYLLESAPDRSSHLSGRNLVAAKVKLLVDMGPKIDPPGKGWNFERDPQSAQYVVEKWPTPIMFSPKEICWAMTGSRMRDAPQADPVREAYELWLTRNKKETNHSADLTAVLYAVRGLRDYWTSVTGGSLEVKPDGFSQWVPGSGNRQSYLVKKMDFDILARELDELLIHPPAVKH
ncbi:MAG: nucleoside hydrolase [Blastocatellia bacterium]|nr:nucleoside hydrolase [Blastocatellia bacterium]